MAFAHPSQHYLLRITQMPKTITLRVDDERAAALELVARVDEQSANSTLIDALDALIEARRNDTEFQERLRKRHQDERALYEKLAG